MINISINLIATYGLSIYDPYVYIGENFTSKQFFITLLIFTYRFIFPFFYNLITINYLINGRVIFEKIHNRLLLFTIIIFLIIIVFVVVPKKEIY